LLKAIQVSNNYAIRKFFQSDQRITLKHSFVRKCL